VMAPFSYFADFDGPLAEAVRAGRLELLAQFPSLRDPEVRDRIANPNDESAFRACQIEWNETEAGAQAWRLHKDLLAIRRSDPVLANLGTFDVSVEASASTPTVLVLRYSGGTTERLLLFNLGSRMELRMNDPLLAPPGGSRWAVAWCSERAIYGGCGVAEAFGDGPWILQSHCAWLLHTIDHDAGAR
jgi:maltooligosyltrehalose trehalohydrolase